jgi:hypothetical protein
MTRRDWWRIIALGLLGNSLFYGLMSAGIVAVGAVPVALVFACLPLVMAAVGNYRRPAFAWRSVAGPFLLVAAGLTVNTVTSVAGEIEGVGPYPVLGFTLAALALLSWLVYGVWNSEYLTDHPLTKSVAWTSQLGLGTLITLPLIFGLDTLMHGHPPIPPTIGLPTLLTWCVILGLGSTWVATWLWSRASLRLGAAASCSSPRRCSRSCSRAWWSGGCPRPPRRPRARSRSAVWPGACSRSRAADVGGRPARPRASSSAARTPPAPTRTPMPPGRPRNLPTSRPCRPPRRAPRTR